MSRSRLFARGVFLVMAVCIWTAAATAQVSPGGSSGAPPPAFASPGGPTPLSGTVDPEIYRLGPGDALIVFVWGPISRTFPLDVGPDGVVFIPDMGPLFLAGLTLSEARDEIQRLIQQNYRGVRVQTKLQRVRSFIVYRTGEFRAQGPVLAHGSSLLIDLLPDSLFTPGASRRNILVRHADGSEYRYDLLIFQLAGQRTASDALQGGDIIHVPRAKSRVGVWGGVARPGEYELGPYDLLSTLLLLGDGLLPSALRDSALFVRGVRSADQESIWVSLDDVESGDYDPELKDGDNLYVAYNPDYRSLQRVSVVGQVRRAGDLPIDLGRTRFSDAIASAGGFRADADTSAIHLIRTRPDEVGLDVEFQRLSRLARDEMTESEYESFRTQLAALSPDFRIEWERIGTGDEQLDPILMDGDVIRVDRRTNTIRVDGQVRRPGVFEHEAGKKAGHYIRLAGGFTERGSRTKVRVTRSVNGQSVRSHDVDSIRPGDFIWVPERPDKTAWDYLKEVLLIGGQVAIIVTAIRR